MIFQIIIILIFLSLIANTLDIQTEIDKVEKAIRHPKRSFRKIIKKYSKNTFIFCLFIWVIIPLKIFRWWRERRIPVY